MRRMRRVRGKRKRVVKRGDAKQEGLSYYELTHYKPGYSAKACLDQTLTVCDCTHEVLRTVSYNLLHYNIKKCKRYSEKSVSLVF